MQAVDTIGDPSPRAPSHVRDRAEGRNVCGASVSKAHISVLVEILFFVNIILYISGIYHTIVKLTWFVISLSSINMYSGTGFGILDWYWY